MWLMVIGEVDTYMVDGVHSTWNVEVMRFTFLLQVKISSFFSVSSIH